MDENVKQFLSKKVLIVMTVMVIVTLFVAPVNAAVNGNLLFYHGVNNFWKYTFGKITSTATENSMSIDGHIYFESGPNSGSSAYYQGIPVSNTKSITKNIYPGSVKGSSFFQYYVDGSMQHYSTAWWSFDFR